MLSDEEWQQWTDEGSCILPSAMPQDVLAREPCQSDIRAAVACFAPDGTVWHSFDCVTHDRDSMARDWAGFVGAYPERAFVDARRQATANGCVQQHLMVGRPATGARKAWPVCVVVRVGSDGLIARLDEYIDRAGVFLLNDDAPAVTPGLD